MCGGRAFVPSGGASRVRPVDPWRPRAATVAGKREGTTGGTRLAMKVCMFVLVECDQYSISARRAAQTLTEAGHDVTVIAYLDKGLPAREETDGYTILRVKLLSVNIQRLGLARWLT